MNDSTGNHKHLYGEKFNPAHGLNNQQISINRQMINSLEANKKKLNEIDKKCDRITSMVDSLQMNVSTLMDNYFSNNRKANLHPDLQESTKKWYDYNSKHISPLTKENEMGRLPYSGYANRMSGPYMSDPSNMAYFPNMPYSQYNARYSNMTRDSTSSGSGDPEPSTMSAEYGGSSMSSKSIHPISNHVQRNHAHFDEASIAKARKSSLKRDGTGQELFKGKYQRTVVNDIDHTTRERASNTRTMEPMNLETSSMDIAAKNTPHTNFHETVEFGSKSLTDKDMVQGKRFMDNGNALNSLEDSNSPSVSHSQALSYHLPVPQYVMEKSLKTISEIWREYNYGFNEKPPLKHLEAKYGTKWRNESESRTYLRRKKIYDAIEYGLAKGFSEETIIEDLEKFRTFEVNGTFKKRPLSWLVLNIPSKYTGSSSEPIN